MAEKCIRRVEEIADERLSVSLRIRLPCTPKHKNLQLIDRMADPSQGLNPLRELIGSYKIEPFSPETSRLVREIATGVVRMIWAVVTVPLAAKLLLC